MRRNAQVLAVAGAVAGMSLTALPAAASTLAAGSAARPAASKPTPAQQRVLQRAARIRAALSKKGAVTGMVLRPDGAPQAGVCVRAIGTLATRTAFTKPDGEFVIAGLPLGAYRVEYRGCSPIARFTAQWYGGLTRATAAKVMVTSQLPARLAPVRLSMIAPQFTAGASATRRIGSSPGTPTAATALVTGRFKLAPAYRKAARAGTLATISGKVTAAGGHPVRSVCVFAVPAGIKSLLAFGLARTTKQGTYSLRTPPGRYDIDFLTACSGAGNYAPQLWKAASSDKTATVLRVKSRQRIAGINAVLRPGARITGQLRAAGGARQPLGGICVFATGRGGQQLFEGEANTRADGTFRLPSLATGSYVLSVSPQCAHVSDYLPVTLTKPVAVTDGKTTAGVAAVLRLGGTVTGKVRDPNGHLLSGICVAVGTGRVSYSGRTAPNGTFHIEGVAPGSYKMLFGPGCGNNGPFAPLTLPGQVTVAAGKITAGVDAVLPFDGSISGTVTGPHGNPLAGACVAADSTSGNFGFAVTGANGTYKIKNAPPGNYQVEFIPGGSFSDCGLKGNFLPVSDNATVTTQTTTTLNAVLPNGGVITGVVTGSRGKPLAGICVVSTANPFGNALVTGKNGSYRMDQLFTGSYLVGFEGGCGNTGSVAPVAYKGDPTFFGPRNIAVTQGMVTPGISAQMRPGGTLTGRVTDQSGTPVSGECVFIEAVTGAGGDGEFADLGLTKNGRYGAANLPPGQYAVFFSGHFSRNRGCGPSALADQEFMGRGIDAVPDLISVPGGAFATGVDATLVPAGRISGAVLASGGRPLAGMCVTASDLATGAIFETSSARKGKYELDDLAPGRYDVEFSNCGGGFFIGSSPNFANQWYKDKATESAATAVVVSASRTTTGIDAAMTPGGSLAGQVVYRPDSRPVSFVCVVAFTPDLSVFAQAVTDRRGNYVITGLSTGSYLLEYEPCASESALASQVRKGTVHVSVGHTVRGVREQLTIGGSISGKVSFTGTAGTHSAPGTCVEVLPLFATGLGDTVVTGPGGTFTAPNLAPGPYLLAYGIPDCSNDWPTLASHTSKVTYVTARHDTPGADATLQLTGAISGTVRGPSGQAVAGLCAIAQRPLGGSSPVVAVTGKGGYKIGGLQPGAYKIEFTTGCGATGFATRWYKNARGSAGGTRVLVQAGQTTGGINGQLPRG